MSSGTPTPGRRQASRTKIVATVGPACRSPAQLTELAAAGVDVFRLNMAHGNLVEHGEVVEWIRASEPAAGRPLGILADLAGPKIRLGDLPGGQFVCEIGATVCFVRGTSSETSGELAASYEPLLDELAVGDSIMLADGTVSLSVVGISPERANCRVVQPGLVRSRQGINLPGVKLSAPAMDEEDWQHAEWAVKAGIDFVGLSFVRGPDEVVKLKEYLRERGSKALVVAKIEKPEALDRLEEIILAADAVMVARGDLGVEIDVARTPIVQKQVIATCQALQRPVIVATQMLDSMQHSRRPTRAEATDVANAILDGADACMLSGETAIGEHPRLAVEMMHRIALITEENAGQRTAGTVRQAPAGLHPITQAVVHGAGQIAAELGAKLIVVASRTGATALAASKLRAGIPTLGVSDEPATLRQMCLYWGVLPLFGAPVQDPKELLKFVSAWGQKEGLLAAGDRIVLLVGSGLGTAGHNIAVVHEL